MNSVERKPLNIERSFTFAFKTPNGAAKLLRGGLYSILFFTGLFAFVVAGYGIRILCNSLEGRDARLPDWEGLVTLFREGVQPVLVLLTYVSPIFLIAIAGMYVAFPIDPFLLSAFFLLCASIIIPLALIRYVVIGDIRAAFNLRAIFSYIRNNQGGFFNAWFVSIGTWFLCGVIIGAVFFLVALLFSSLSIQAGGIAGIIAAVIVMGPLTFTAQVVLVHLFAQSYRIAQPFTDDQDGVFRASMVMPPSLRQKKPE